MNKSPTASEMYLLKNPPIGPKFKTNQIPIPIPLVLNFLIQGTEEYVLYIRMWYVFIWWTLILMIASITCKIIKLQKINPRTRYENSKQLGSKLSCQLQWILVNQRFKRIWFTLNLPQTNQKLFKLNSTRFFIYFNSKSSPSIIPNDQNNIYTRFWKNRQ